MQCFSLVWVKEPYLDRRMALDARHEFMDLKFDRCGLELAFGTHTPPVLLTSPTRRADTYSSSPPPQPAFLYPTASALTLPD